MPLTPRRLKEIEAATDAAARLFAAATEAAVFAVLAEVCGTASVGAETVVHAVGLDGRTVRATTASDGLTARLASEEIERWLTDPEAAPPSLAPADGGERVVWRRLVAEGRIVGGVGVAGPHLDAADARRCDVFAGLAATRIAELRRKRLADLMAETIAQTDAAIGFYDPADGLIFANDAHRRMFPDGADDDGRADPATSVGARREIETVGERTFLCTRQRSANGAIVARRIDITDTGGDAARLREREDDLRALAFHDSLTGLSNEVYLTQVLLPGVGRRIAAGEIAGCVLFRLRLRDFRLIDDAHGRACGDGIVAATAERLASAALGADAVLRIGSDEFAVLFERTIAPRGLASLADRVIERIEEPIRHADLEIRPAVSLGIARLGPGGDTTAVLGDADLALDAAARQTGSAFRFFEPRLRQAKIERLALVDDVRRALAGRDFELHYQPQFSTATGRLTGFEALARWTHPIRGAVSPATFVPILEEQGLIEGLGEWALRTACAEARAWPDDVIVAVNVSPLQVRGARFSLILADTLLRTGLPPHRLELEITESVFLDDVARARAELESWKALGVRIALDDFGCGYSSLAYLSVFPVDKIKIDRVFLARFDPASPDREAGVVLGAIIDLGRALGITVTAEGVETPEQLDHLRASGCAEAQGFLLGRPMPAAEARRIARRAREPRASLAV